jgi:hypothetical protein
MLHPSVALPNLRLLAVKTQCAHKRRVFGFQFSVFGDYVKILHFCSFKGLTVPAIIFLIAANYLMQTAATGRPRLRCAWRALHLLPDP